MPEILLHSFTTVTPQEIEIFYDDITDFLYNTSDFEPLETPVTESDLGVPIGHIFRQFCRETTRVTVMAQIHAPFAYVEYETDSPSCGGAPVPCEGGIDDIETTDETALGAHDGTATVNSFGTPVEYSLDGINWQADNHFYNLIPGNYMAYARFTPSCIESRTFTILAGPAPPPIVPYPWQEKICRFFRLLIPDGIGGFTTYAIREPIKWDGIEFIGKRSREWHGYRGMFSDGIVSLEFDCYSGMDEIINEKETKGNDAEVILHFGYTYLGIEYFLFKGTLNFNTYKKYPGKVSCSVEKEDFNVLFQSRFDTKVSMAALVTHDDLPITAPSIIDFILHAKEIVRNYSAVSAEPQNYTLPGFPGVAALYYQPDTSAPQLSEIETNYGYPLGISTINPGTEEKFNWDIEFNGDYSFVINYSFNITFKRLTGAGNYDIKSYFRVNGVLNQIGATISGANSAFPQTVAVNVNGTFNNQQLVAGDKVYFYTEIVFSNGALQTASSVQQNSINTTAQSLENAGDSECKGWLWGEALNHAIRVISNNTSRLRSSFLQTIGYNQSADGSGSLYIVTNGKQIRRFDVANAPLKISTKELMNSAKSLFCLGYGFEKVGVSEQVRVERANYFYRNKEIIVIDDCAEYREEVAKDLIYNELEIGYDKYQDSGYNTLDEFNTRHEHLTPIKTNKLKAVMKSSLIASGYSIEESRRKQFEDTATESFQNDDEGFIIAVKRDSIIPPAFTPEKDEAFDVVDNLISPGTAYNLRISPFRMLLNWAIWLKGIFFYKPGTENIKNTFFALNGDLQTRFKPTEVNPVGDINLLEWEEKQNISLTNFAVEERIWKPDWIFFKCRLTPDKIQIINESMVGNWDPNTNYGYIVVKDDEGVYQAGFLDELKYNYTTEEASFTLIKKWDAPTDPGEGCCSYLFINGCKILINGDPVTINV